MRNAGNRGIWEYWEYGNMGIQEYGDTGSVERYRRVTQVCLGESKETGQRHQGDGGGVQQIFVSPPQFLHLLQASIHSLSLDTWRAAGSGCTAVRLAQIRPTHWPDGANDRVAPGSLSLIRTGHCGKPSGPTGKLKRTRVKVALRGCLSRGSRARFVCWHRRRQTRQPYPPVLPRPRIARTAA